MLLSMSALTSCIYVTTAMALLVALAGAPQTAALEDHWAQWRGPDGLGVAKGTSYADEWSAQKNVAWQVPVEGRDHSSLVVWGNLFAIRK